MGNLIRRKGLHTLLDVLAQLPQSACVLRVVGDEHVDPRYAQSIYRQIKRLGLGSRVTFTGRLPDNALAQLLMDSHLLVTPSTYEGFGIVYLEGMGFGLPAIGGASGGANELIRPGHNGYLVEPGQSAVLAQRLAELAADRRLLFDLGRAALETHRRHPTWEQSMAGIRQFLQSV